jgi:hypothetical protein
MPPSGPHPGLHPDAKIQRKKTCLPSLIPWYGACMYPGCKAFKERVSSSLKHRLTARFCWKDPDIAVSCEAMPVPGKYRSGYLQSSIGWNTGPPMEEIQKVLKELKGSETLWEEQYELTSTPRVCVSSCICSRRWPSQPSLGRKAPWSCKLYMPQYRGMPGSRSRSGWVGEQGGGRV